MTDHQRDPQDLIRSQIRRITKDLEYIRDEWGNLLESRLKGTPRPWAEHQLSDDERTAADDLASVERREKAYGIGEHPAPLHLEVFDVIQKVTKQMLDLEAECRTALGFGPATHAHRVVAVDEPSGLTHWAALWISDALPAISDKPELLDKVTTKSHDMMTTVMHCLGDSDGSVVLKTTCFSCGWVNSLKMVPDQARLVESYVVCTNPGCDPEMKCCFQRIHGMASWYQEHWDWLVEQCDLADAARLEAAETTEDVA